jgi:parallel beta-helix repeat protein
MRNKSNKKILIFLELNLILLPNLFILNNYFWILGKEVTENNLDLTNIEYNEKDSQLLLKTQAYTTHAPISITGNANFHTYAASEGWNSGGRDGTIAKPYLIKDLNITSTSITIPLTLYNIDLYFSFENNIFNGGDYGVYLSNVQHGGFFQNIILNNKYRSITVSGSNFNVFIANTVGGAYDAYNSRGDGIYLGSSNNNSLINNYVSNNIQNGIEVYYSQNNTIRGNTVYNNSYNGIYMESSAFHNTILYNDVYDNDNLGIDIGDNNSLIGNTVHDQNYGVKLGSFNLIKENFIWNNLFSGISGSYSVLNIILNNSIYNQNEGAGIYLYIESNNNTIENNSIFNNERGIWLSYNFNNSIINNILTNNLLEVEGSNLGHFLQGEIRANLVNGKPLVFWKNMINKAISSNAGQIILVNSSNIEVSGLIIQNSNPLLVAYSKEIFIHNNSFSLGKKGIQILYSDVIRILRNEIFNNSDSGIYIYKSKDLNIAYNEIYYNNLLFSGLASGGAYIAYSNYTEISQNFFDQNIYFNLYVEYNYYLTVSNNIFRNSSYSVALSHVNFGLITTNDIFNNSEDGMYGSYLINSTVVGNTISKNSKYGLLLLYAYNSSIIWNNLVSNNLGTGNSQIYDSLVTTNIKYNYYNDWTGIGNYTTDFSKNNDTYPQTSPHVLINPEILFPIKNDILQEHIFVNVSPVTDSVGHTVTYYLYYSINDGFTWDLITASSSNMIEWESRFFNNRSDYKLKVIAIDEVGARTENISELFSISNVAHSLSIPLILNPNESMNVSGILSIRWANAIDSWYQNVTYSIYYSANNGNTWTLLASDISSTTFFWNTSVVTSGSDYLIRVKAISKGIFSELNSEDISNEIFSINSGAIPSETIVTITTTVAISDTVTITIYATSTITESISPSFSTTSSGTASGFLFTIFLFTISVAGLYVKRKQNSRKN